jgi:tetratricopeptide (TPR) repeat protein
MSFITRQGRALLLTAVLAVALSGCGGGGGGNRPSALVGHWVHYEGDTRGKPDDIELFKDGTGVVDGGSVTWKVENKRLVFLSSSQGLSCNYEVSGYELVLAYDDEKSAIFVKKERFEEYKKKKEEVVKRIEELKEQFDKYLEKDMYDNAIELSNEIIKIAPKSARGYAYRGNAYYDGKKDYDRAIADYTMALKLDPEGPEGFFEHHGLYYVRGNSYTEKGDYDKALADYNKAIQLAPNYLDYYNARGWAYIEKGDYDKALADFNKAIQLAPNEANLYDSRGDALVAAALAVYNNAIQLDSKDVDYYNGRGYAYLKKGDYDKALTDFNKAVQLAPNEANPYDSRGEAYLTIGDYDKAIADYSKALQLDPTFESAKEGLEKAKQKKQGR